MPEGLSSLQPGVDCLCVDCSDPPGLAAWWQQLVGGDVSIDSDGDVMLAGEGMRLLFLSVPEHKVGKNRLHLDLRATSFDTAIDAAVALGAQRADDVYDGPRWKVFRDPEGNEFCILPPRST